MSKIFISYRRDDTKDIVGRIFDYLANHFEEKNIFKDIDSIPLGSDFREVIEKSVDKCDVILVIIGKQWLQITDEEGKRRLDSQDDFVRIEIEAGLNRDIPIIPVLVADAKVPSHNDLPKTLANLSFRHGISIRPDPDFKNDINTLIYSLDKIIKPPKKNTHIASIFSIFLAVMTLSILAIYYVKPLFTKTSDTSSIISKEKKEPTPLFSKEEQYLINLGIDQELISKAKSGNPEYEGKLGWTLWQKSDSTRSIKWNKKAAEHGDRFGQKRTGLHYQQGFGVDKNFKKAAYWHELAAKQDDHYSKYNLALIYANGGYGLSRNLIEAYKWSILANEVLPSPEGNDALLKDLEKRLSNNDKINAKKLANDWLNKQNDTDTNKLNVIGNKNLRLLTIPNQDNIATLEIESLKSTQYYSKKNTLVFLNWGNVNSQEKIINTNSSRISFKYKISNDKLKDSKGKVWQPKLRIVLSEKKLSKDKGNIHSDFGITINLPSNEEHVTIKSKYEFNTKSKYKGMEIFKPSIWYDLNIEFSKNTYALMVNGKKIINEHKASSDEQYYLVISSWNSGDFQIKDLKIQ